MGIIADKIRQAIYGIDVREDIAQGIEVTEQLRADYDKQVINAGNSNAEIVAARGGEVSLPVKINKIDSSLSKKANMGEITSSDLKTLNDSDRIGLLNLKEEVIQAMTGNTMVNATVGDGTVTPIKTSFFKEVTKNLFDKSARTVGYYVDYLTGMLVEFVGVDVSAFIQVLPSTVYHRTHDNRVAFYDADKVFISGINTGSGLLNITTPSNCKYMRISVAVQFVDIFQLEIGSIGTNYEGYKQPIITKDNIETNFDINTVNDNEIPFEKVSFADSGKNLFNSTTKINGYHVNNIDGKLIANESFTTTDYIAVKADTKYIGTTTRFVAFYDKNKVFISGITNASGTGSLSVSTPAECKYIRWSFLTTGIALFQIELGKVLTTYEPFNVNFLSNSKFKQCKNLFNLQDTVKDFYCSQTTGLSISFTGLQMSNYISVLPNTIYYRNLSTRVCFFDDNKVFISGDFTIGAITTPVNCKYVIISATDSDVLRLQFEKGDVGTNYEDFGYTVDNLKPSNELELIKLQERGFKHPMGGAIAMTFDGTYATHLDYARILASYGQRASFYIQTKGIGDPAGLYNGGNGQLCLTASEILEMEAMGHEIGTHSDTHPDFTTITEERIIEELEVSISKLKEIGVKNIGGFAYPVGKYNDFAESVIRRYVPYARITGALAVSVTPNINTSNPSNINNGNIHKFNVNSLFFMDGNTQEFREKFKKKILDAKNRGYVLCIYMHSTLDIGGEGVFRELCEYCRFIGMPVVPAMSVIKSYNLAHAIDWNFTNLANWSMSGDITKYTVSLDSTNKFAGDTSLKIVPNGSASTEILNITPVLGSSISVYEGQRLSISYRLNLPSSLAGEGISLSIKGYTSVNAPITLTIPLTRTITGGWVTKSAEYIVPKNVYAIYPIIHAQFTNGVAYVDMLEIIPLDQERLL